MRRIVVTFLLMIFCLVPGQRVYAEDIVRLVWHPIVGAVLYEVALTSDSKGEQVLWQDTCSANGIELEADVLGAKYYRVRAIDYDHRPIDAEQITGVLNKADRADGVPYILFAETENVPIYPVYTWVPVYGATAYEIEVADHEMRSRYISTRDARKITVVGGSVFDYYDEQPLVAGENTWYRIRTYYADGRRSAWSKSVCMKKARTAYYGAIGDSITHGGGSITHTPNEEAYAWMHYTGREIVNLGLSGDVAKRIADRVQWDATSFDVQVLFIMGGINDLRAGESAENVIDALSQAVQSARKAGIRPILLTIPPCNPRLMTERMGYPLEPSWQREWRTVNEWIVKQEDAIDVSQAVTDADGYLDENVTTDGLHPDAEGKQRIGTVVREYLDAQNMP